MLNESEVARIRAELGFNVLSNAAAPWVSTVSYFDQVVVPNLPTGEPETIVRELLERIRVTKEEMAGTFGQGALKKCDELEFYDTGLSSFGSTATVLMFWRDELASVLGAANAWRLKHAAGSTVAIH